MGCDLRPRSRSPMLLLRVPPRRRTKPLQRQSLKVPGLGSGHPVHHRMKSLISSAFRRSRGAVTVLHDTLPFVAGDASGGLCRLIVLAWHKTDLDGCGRPRPRGALPEPTQAACVKIARLSRRAGARVTQNRYALPKRSLGGNSARLLTCVASDCAM